MLKDPAEEEFLQQKKEFLKFLGIPLLSFLYTPLMQKGTERNVQPSLTPGISGIRAHEKKRA